MNSNITIGEKYRPAMEMKDQVTAAAYFLQCVEHCMSFGKSREEAEAIERSNLGYFAGYYDHETRARVEHLFHCQHPIFGSIATHGIPTVEQALNAGITLAQAKP